MFEPATHKLAKANVQCREMFISVAHVGNNCRSDNSSDGNS